MREVVKCFCFPFAGGSKYSYNKFIEMAKPELEIISMELPGHGSLVREKLLTDMNLIVDYLFNKIRPQLNDNYIFYGHSMGSLVAYLLTRKIIENGFSGPMHLFVSGCAGPSELKRERKRHTLPKKLFLSRVKELGGVPDNIDDELLDFFEPIIRADFQAIETYEYIPKKPIEIPITVGIGIGENVTVNAAQAWDRETLGLVRVQEYQGNHFFIFDQAEHLIEEMKKTLFEKTFSTHEI